MYINYHCHTARCGHADVCGDEEYVRRAVDNGFSILGFSDHTPWPYRTAGYAPRGTRMDVAELEGYVRSIRSLQETWGHVIRLYVGLECEYYPDYLPWLRRTVQEQGLDFLILGNHWPLTDETGARGFAGATEPEAVTQYGALTVRGMQTELFRYLAHPDIVFCSYPSFDAACEQASLSICRAAKALDLPLEYNLYGVDKMERGIVRGIGYPLEAFWQIAAAEGCTAIVGLDAHRLTQFDRPTRFDEAKTYLRGLGMRVLDALPGLDAFPKP